MVINVFVPIDFNDVARINIQFFLELTMQRIRRSLAGFNFAAGKFPFQRKYG